MGNPAEKTTGRPTPSIVADGPVVVASFFFVPPFPWAHLGTATVAQTGPDASRRVGMSRIGNTPTCRIPFGEIPMHRIGVKLSRP